MIIDMIMELGKDGTIATNNNEELNKRWGVKLLVQLTDTPEEAERMRSVTHQIPAARHTQIAALTSCAVVSK